MWSLTLKEVVQLRRRCLVTQSSTGGPYVEWPSEGASEDVGS